MNAQRIQPQSNLGRLEEAPRVFSRQKPLAKMARWEVGRRAENLIGKKFGLLTPVARIRKPNGDLVWECRCDCGGLNTLTTDRLKSGQTKSCGCLRVEALKKRSTHNLTKTSEYQVWAGMIARCERKCLKSYARYGGRGITVCARWRDSFEAFLEDMGKRPSGCSIERKDNNQGYSPENCIWANSLVQQNNTSKNIYATIKGRKMSVAQWARELGVSEKRAYERIASGWSPDRALLTPKLK